MGASLRIRYRFAQFLLLGIEQTQLNIAERLASHERKKMERESARITFPDRADVG